MRKDLRTLTDTDIPNLQKQLETILVNAQAVQSSRGLIIGDILETIDQVRKERALPYFDFYAFDEKDESRKGIAEASCNGSQESMEFLVGLNGASLKQIAIDRDIHTNDGGCYAKILTCWTIAHEVAHFEQFIDDPQSIKVAMSDLRFVEDDEQRLKIWRNLPSEIECERFARDIVGSLSLSEQEQKTFETIAHLRLKDLA